jgi:hypothetical protein
MYNQLVNEIITRIENVESKKEFEALGYKLFGAVETIIEEIFPECTDELFYDLVKDPQLINLYDSMEEDIIYFEKSYSINTEVKELLRDIS